MYYNRVKMINSASKEEFVLWQVIDEGQVTGYVNKENKPVKLPRVYEMVVDADALEVIE